MKAEQQQEQFVRVRDDELKTITSTSSPCPLLQPSRTSLSFPHAPLNIMSSSAGSRSDVQSIHSSSLHSNQKQLRETNDDQRHFLHHNPPYYALLPLTEFASRCALAMAAILTIDDNNSCDGDVQISSCNDGDDYIVDEEELASLDFDDLLNDDEEDDDAPTNAISVPRIARQINEYLSKDGEGSIGHTIAELHEIEVTTPEFDNVLRGQLFQVYKGFDVIVDHWELKKQKKKTTKGSSDMDGENNDYDDDVQKKRVKTEGKLVERDMEKNVTIINVKGRNKKIKNDLIESVELPKAKREKGVN
eukprot:scaffold41027_cov53-Cyclotella_meneghiniana.AAC.3